MMLGTWLLDSRIQDTITEDPVSLFYLVEYDDIPIGHSVRTAVRKKNDRILVTNLLEFRVSEGRFRRVFDSQEFESRWPYPLIRAFQTDGIRDQPLGNRRVVVGQHSSASDTGALRLNGSFNFLDTPFFQRDMQKVGGQLTTRTIDYYAARVVETDWIAIPLESKIDSRIYHNPSNRATLVLDQSGTIEHSTSSGRVVLSETDTLVEAAAWRDMEALLPSGSIAVATDGFPEDLSNHRQAEFQFEFETTLVTPWHQILDENAVLVLKANTQLTTNRQSSESRVPNRHDSLPFDLDALVTRTKKTKNQQDLIAQLVEGVRDYLTYVDSELEMDLDQIVNTRLGDCSEHAELFNHLAANAGMQVRTVIGLKYHRAHRTFHPHAWNKVLIGDDWHGVDPTLGRTNVDVGYIPFPSDDLIAMLRSLRGLKIEYIGSSD